MKNKKTQRFVETEEVPPGLSISQLDEETTQPALQAVEELLLEHPKQMTNNHHFFINLPFPLNNTMGKASASVDTIPSKSILRCVVYLPHHLCTTHVPCEYRSHVIIKCHSHYFPQPLQHRWRSGGPPLYSLDDLRVSAVVLCVENSLRAFGIAPEEALMGRSNVIVREYLPGQRIGFHVDDLQCDSFVLGVVLLNGHPEGRGLQLRADGLRYSLREQAGCAFLMEDQARFHWKHGVERVSHRRLSVTCRFFKETAMALVGASQSLDAVPAAPASAPPGQIRVTLVDNGNSANRKPALLAHSGAHLAVLLKMSRQKLRVKATLLFLDATGEPIEEGARLADGDLIYCSIRAPYSGPRPAQKTAQLRQAADAEQQQEEEEASGVIVSHPSLLQGTHVYCVAMDEAFAEEALRHGCVFFWRHGEAHGYLCQWAHSVFRSDSGDTFCCAEQWMMHQKAVLFRDEATARRILRERQPKKQKALGRQVRNFSEKSWANRQRIVFHGNLLKFTQNPDMLAKLMDTGNRCLVEASPADRIWGIGMQQGKDEGIQDPRNWRGLNLLGRVLMAVRSAIKEQQTESL